MSHFTENRGVLLKFQDKLSQLKQAKGVTKKKLKAKEFNLRRKMGICFRCISTSHTKVECPKTLKHNININVPYAAETGNEKKDLPLQQIIQTYTENYNEKYNTMLTDMDVDKVDNLLLDNLLESLTIPEYTSLNAHQEMNHKINGGEIGHNFQLQTTEYQEYIQDESLYEIKNFATINNETGMELQDRMESDLIDEDYIPLVISRGIIPEKSENMLPKEKKSTRKVGRPKKSTVNIKPINNASEKDQGAYSKNMSILYTINNADYIPLVIQPGIIPEKSKNVPPKKKKST